ncbi:MAG: hypothetical protein ABFR53_11685, partial [Actinomycetota bacterium]
MTFLEFGLVAWIVLIGLATASAFWPYQGAGLALVSPSIGAALYGLSALVMFTIGRFSTLGSLLVASVGALAMAGYGRWQGSMAAPRTVAWASVYALAGT